MQAPELTRPRAILMDALDTLVTFEHPGPHLRDELRERLGIEVSEEQARAAIRAEIKHYRANLHLGRDVETLATLRRECATIMLDHLPPEVRDADLDVVTAALVAAIRFEPYPDVLDGLRALRAHDDVRLAVLSNWDVSLHDMLDAVGISDLVDAAVSSAEHGTAKPDPDIFEHALALVGVRPEEAWHVGDSPENDVAGARAAGVTPVLLWRGPTPPATDAPVIGDLGQLLELLERARPRD